MIKKIKTEDFPLMDGYECRQNIALVEGKKGFIVTESDLVHALFESEEEKVRLTITEKDSLTPHAIEVTIKELKKYLGQDINLKEWIHYFGIKGRVWGNYKTFQKSCREIGAKLEFPVWEK